MRNIQFLVAGIFLITLIVVTTLVFEQESPRPVPPGNGGVTDGDGDGEHEPDDVTSVQVYFGNSTFDPNVEHCDVAYPVSRTVAETPALPKAALEELLMGVTATETAQGYFSSLPAGGEVESLVIVRGVATVTFTENFKNGLAGSCKVAAIRAQIEQTLKQFGDITAVQIKIIGVPDEEVLQP